jgi:hypothetical protein
MAIELALAVCCDLLIDMGLEFLAEGKNCWTAVVMEIVSGVAGGREGNVCFFVSLFNGRSRQVTDVLQPAA